MSVDRQNVTKDGVTIVVTAYAGRPPYFTLGYNGGTPRQFNRPLTVACKGTILSWLRDTCKIPSATATQIANTIGARDGV